MPYGVSSPYSVVDAQSWQKKKPKDTKTCEEKLNEVIAYNIQYSTSTGVFNIVH